MSVKEKRARKDIVERRICTGSRAVEWILCAMALWAGLVMAWTPTVLRHNPPPFYQVINRAFPAMEIGLMIAFVPLVHLIGLLLSTCPCAAGADAEKLEVRIGAKCRGFGAMGQVGVWLFLVVIYALLWEQQGEVTFGSGACVILLVCASVTSHCVSKENSRRRARQDVARMLRDNQGRPTDELLERLTELHT